MLLSPVDDGSSLPARPGPDTLARTVDSAQATRPAIAEVDLGAVASNYRALAARLPPGVQVLASIKANAYGHGAVEVARTLAAEGAAWLATGTFAEALAVREAGIETPILLFAGPLPEAVPKVLRHGFALTVHNAEIARAVAAAAMPATVFVKADAGLGRLGVPLEQAEALIRELDGLPHVHVRGLYTHLPFVDAEGRDWAAARLPAFRELRARLEAAGLAPEVTQALSSAGVLAGLPDNSSAICPGHALYGIPPASGEVAGLAGLRPALRAVTTRLVQVTDHPSERRVGTGGKIALGAGARTGIVPFGRTDGYRGPREGTRAFMLAGGHRVPVRGVSLEHTTLDLTGVAARVGDQVTVLGRQGAASVSAVEIAEWQGATVDDVVLSFDRKVPRRYLPAAPP